MKLKKAANILFLIGAIVAIVVGVCYLLTSITFLVLGTSQAFRQAVIDGINSGAVQSDFTPEEAADVLQAVFLALGIVFLVPTACSIPSCIFSFKARNTDKKAFFVLNIVFGILGSTIVNVVGGVFGLVKGDTIVTEEPAVVEQKAE